jgi:hypothetical protein
VTTATTHNLWMPLARRFATAVDDAEGKIACVRACVCVCVFFCVCFGCDCLVRWLAIQSFYKCGESTYSIFFLIWWTKCLRNWVLMVFWLTLHFGKGRYVCLFECAYTHMCVSFLGFYAFSLHYIVVHLGDLMFQWCLCHSTLSLISSIWFVEMWGFSWSLVCVSPGEFAVLQGSVLGYCSCAGWTALRGITWVGES